MTKYRSDNGKELICSLAIPTIISMLITSIYNIADTFFVSQLGTSAAGAVGVVFSLMAIIQAVGFMLGMGCGSNISRLLRQHNKKDADYIASSAFFTALLFGLFMTVLGILFLNPLMRILGATETILPYASDYASYILLGAPLMCGSFVPNNILRSEGNAVLAMCGIATVLACARQGIFFMPLILILPHIMGLTGIQLAQPLSDLFTFISCIFVMISFLKELNRLIDTQHETSP